MLGEEKSISVNLTVSFRIKPNGRVSSFSFGSLQHDYGADLAAQYPELFKHETDEGDLWLTDEGRKYFNIKEGEKWVIQ